MSKEAQSVPIVTLAGVANIGDFLSELPLPKKTKKEVISLFPNNKTSSDAWKIIQKQDINLAVQLANVLNQVNTDHLKLKDGVIDDANIGAKNTDPKLMTLLAQSVSHLLQTRGESSQQSDFSINSMMGNTTNTPLVNGRAGLHEQQAALSQQFNASGPSYQAQMNTPGQAFSPLKTRRMRTTSATPLSNSNNQNNELQQGVHSNVSARTQMATPVQEFSPLKTRGMRSGLQTPLSNNRQSQGNAPGQPAFDNEYHNSDQLNVQRNLNNLQEFNENISKSGKQAEMPKNGYVTPSRHETPRTELMNQMQEVPDDILCGPVETTGKHSHASKKHKKSKKHKLYDNDDSCTEEDVESSGIHIQSNALATDNISVVDSSENFSPAKGKSIPKIIISRNTEDSNKFIVKENSTNSENSLKRRRSTEDSDHKLHDGKRSKSEKETNGNPILMMPSIPIKLDRRLSVRLEDVYDYRQSTSYKRFSENMENMFDFDDQCDISSSIENESQEVDAEFLLTRTALSEMCTETAKLKSMKTLSK
ncbi:Hypothetical predicted protein, partial [Paramuricea clavata]